MCSAVEAILPRLRNEKAVINGRDQCSSYLKSGVKWCGHVIDCRRRTVTEEDTRMDITHKTE